LKYAEHSVSRQYPFADASEELKQAVWQKGRIIPDFDSGIWRWDIYGSVMQYAQHGNTDSSLGWEIDHIYPQSLGGSDNLYNLQPLQWENNRKKGDSVG